MYKVKSQNVLVNVLNMYLTTDIRP